MADDIGLVKEVDCKSSESRYVWNETGADMSTTRLCWVNASSSLLAVSRTSGAIDIFECSPDSNRWCRKSSVDVEGDILDMTAHDGVVLVLTDEALFSIEVEGSTVRIESTRTLPQGPYSVARFSHHSSTLPTANLPTRILTARDDACPVVIGIENMDIVWVGKNAPNTTLGLTAVFRTSCLLALTETVFAAGDETGKLRLYDTSAQRKPIVEFPIFDAFTLTNNYTGTSGMGQVRPIKAMAFSADRLFVGDTFGTVLALDMKSALAKSPLVSPEAKIGTAAHKDFCRKLIPMGFALKNIMGSVRDIALTKEYAFVVSAGRFAYEFDLASKGKKCSKMFLKQKLTCCLPVVGETAAEPQAFPAEDESEADLEAVDASAEAMLEKLNDEGPEMPMSKSKRRRIRKGSSK